MRLFDAHDVASHNFRLVSDDQPMILSFRNSEGRKSSAGSEQAVQRAKLLRENDQCPHCRHAVVEPLELADAMMGRNNRPVPGTGTLVGFHCLRCHWEWPAKSRQRAVCSH